MKKINYTIYFSLIFLASVDQLYNEEKQRFDEGMMIYTTINKLFVC